MQARDWKEPALDYRGEVQSVFHLDREGKVRALLERHASGQGRAIDLGCGTGLFTPLLAENFREVYACDYSADMLAAATRRCAKLGNVQFAQTDLGKAPPAAPPAEFVLCVNVLLSPNLGAREAMWGNLAAAAITGGHIALALPSLESGLFARHRLVEWNLRSGSRGKQALRRGFGSADPDAGAIAHAGVLDAGGVPTKHYLREEIACTAGRFGLEVESCEKIEYPWSTEFNSPPRWMRAPYPWDWLALLRKSR